MSFKLVTKKKGQANFMSCKEFFKPIRDGVEKLSPIKNDMDNFFLCLVGGLEYNLREKYNNYALVEFNSEYTEGFLHVRPLINGLLLTKIIGLKGIDNNQKSKVKKLMQEVIDINDPLNLKPDFIRILHEYYIGGYLKLLSEFDNKRPKDVSVFFTKLNNLLKD